MILLHSLGAVVVATLTCTLVGTSLSAQNRVVVPAQAAAQEQQAAAALPGLGANGRVQFVIDAVALTGLVNRNLTGLEFRRDTTNLRDHELGSAMVTVRVGTATRSAFAAVTDFATNAPVTATVFSGTAQSSVSAVSGFAGWASPHILRIDFTQPFAYSGGPLAIEIDATAIASAWWPVDAATASVSGSSARIGSSCSPAADVSGSSISTNDGGLIVGSTARVTSFTQAGSAAGLLFGLTPLANPLDLTSIGAPDCWLHTLPLAVLPPTMSRVDPWLGGIHEFHIQLPADPAFLSANFVVQGLELGMPGLRTSEALLCQVASSAPALGIAAVWAIGNGVPHVSHDLVPVIGILHD